ncbi:MAG: PKD domain-containing protein, partial [Candidatus Pacearchaeota archaeon]
TDVTSDLLYNIKKMPAKIYSNYSVIKMDNLEFKTIGSGRKEYIIYVGENEVFRKNITIRDRGEIEIKGVYPTVVPVLNPTTFTALILNNINLSDIVFRWNFNDNSGIKNSNENRIVHTFSSMGRYTGIVEAFKSGNNVGSLEFEIIVESPIDEINKTLDQKSKQLKKIEEKINKFEQNYQQIIKERIDFEILKSLIEGYIADYSREINNRVADNLTYIEIFNRIKDTEIPEDIGISESYDVPFIGMDEAIDLSKVNIMFDERYDIDLKEEYKNKILSWILDNVEGKLKIEVISVYYKDRKEDLFSKVRIELTPRKELMEGKYYLIIEINPNNLIDNTDNRFKESSTCFGKELMLKSKEEVFFSIRNRVEPTQIPIYILPESSKIKVENDNLPLQKNKKSFWKIFIPLFSLLLGLAFVVYIFLQEWYKRNYEKSLFKSQNDLYNLIFFIRNAKTKKMNKKEIIKKLTDNGWKKEQIEYALKKENGERTGMWEIPIFKSVENKKMEKEMEKRKGPVQAI